MTTKKNLTSRDYPWDDLKTIDFQFATHQTLQNEIHRHQMQETAHWIAVIDLQEPATNRFTLSFWDKQTGQFTTDRYYRRDEKGNKLDAHPLYYNLSQITNYIGKCMEEFTFLYVFIEEKVGEDGSHVVSIVTPKERELLGYGYLSNSKKPALTREVIDWGKMVYCEEWAPTQKITILSNHKRTAKPSTEKIEGNAEATAA